MILFHHRAVEAQLAETGCRGWNRTSILAFKGRCPTVRRPGNELVEPEVVATSPCRIKSPVPVCCGFDSVKLVGERGLAPPRLTDSRSVGSAHSRLTTRPKNWSPHPELHRADSHTKGVHRSKCFGGLKLASLTGFAPVISCMRGRRVNWTTLWGRSDTRVR